MLTFRKGTGGAPTAAQAMADHLREQTLPEEMAAMADYYLRGVKRADAAATAAVPRQDMAPAVAAALGLDPNRTATHDEVVNLLQGRRADGEAVAGKAAYEVGAGKDRITYVDFTFSAPKSVSVAMALAPTEAERHIIVGSHHDAVTAAMQHLEGIVGHARKGKAGYKGRVRGELGWITFDHYTSRPTVEIPHTEADGTRTTLIQTVKVAGDMQLHTHVTTPNVVVCGDGSVGSIDMLALHDRVHEVGAYYQAHLATNLRAQGIDVVLDQRTEAAHIPSVPHEVCEVFSKRTRDGEAAAREYVKAQGLDWDSMHPMELFGVLKGGARATRRQKETGRRGDDLSDLAAWRAQAARAGYEHRTVVDRTARRLPAPEEDRLYRAYVASLPVLEKQLGRRATMEASAARTAAARGLIAAGVEEAADIDRITAAMREHGVRHDGRQVALMWAELPAKPDAQAVEERRPRLKITTTLHLEQEQEAMRLAAAAAADRSGTLAPERIEAAVARVVERDGLDFDTDHGRAQRRVVDALGTSGRFAVAVGVAGAGKSTLLRPLVEAWTTPADGEAAPREVYGTALAWRQSDQLADAGIKRENTMAIAALLHRAETGRIVLDERSVVVVDELSQVGTAQALGLFRLRERHGFTLVAIGDDRQGQAIDAGNSVRLLRLALGDDAVPELESTVRQRRARDRETTLLFRQGRAEEGIARLREDGHALLVPGGRRQAVEAVADLWEARQRAHAGRAGYSVTVSAPTNADARDVSAAIRERRRRAGAVGHDQVRLQAVDQTGAEYDLPLAAGDRVRLFARTHAAHPAGGRGMTIGNNGSVLEVERIDAEGVQLRSAKGTSGVVKWEALRDEKTGRIRLTYGDAVTIDAIQGATSNTHINALVSGTAASHSFRNYPAQSRGKDENLLVVSDGAERREILSRRALGNLDPITEDEVWANAARNLSRQPEKGLAVDLLERATQVHTGTVRSLATAFQPKQQREAEGRDGTTLHRGFAADRDARDVARAAPLIAAAVRRNGRKVRSAAVATRAAMKDAGRPSLAPAAEARRQAVEARRIARPAAQRPKRSPLAVPVPEAEAAAEFAAALRRAGLRVQGTPRMDGHRQRVAVEGDRKGRRSGAYVGHLDGWPAGHITNFKTGHSETWKASADARSMTEEDRTTARARIEAERARIDAQRAARAAERTRQEEAVARRTETAWSRARPLSGNSHPYLVRKGVRAHGVRVDGRGNLVVPMQDEHGRLWGVQTIRPDGSKLFPRYGRVRGTYAMLGEPQPGRALLLAEGYATAATLHELTGLPVAVAFSGANLGAVAAKLREQDPHRPLVVAADNDHHLPRRELPLPNTGMEQATAAAAKVGGVVLAPEFRPADAGTDWNDWTRQHGTEAAQDKLTAFFEQNGIPLPELPRAGAEAAAATTTQVDRDAARQRATGARSAPSPAQQATERARQQQAGRGLGHAPGV